MRMLTMILGLCLCAPIWSASRELNDDAGRQVAIPAEPKRIVVTELGGEIIREPFESGFGHMSIIADSTGATVTLCEVLPPVEEGRESDPLEGIDLTDFTP